MFSYILTSDVLKKFRANQRILLKISKIDLRMKCTLATFLNKSLAGIPKQGWEHAQPPYTFINILLEKDMIEIQSFLAWLQKLKLRLEHIQRLCMTSMIEA